MNINKILMYTLNVIIFTRVNNYWLYRQCFTYVPFIPNSLAACIGVLPTSLFSLDTTVSAGWETIAQNTPAVTGKMRQLIITVNIIIIFFWLFLIVSWRDYTYVLQCHPVRGSPAHHRPDCLEETWDRRLLLNPPRERVPS